jgi:hypothetical protein
MEPMCDGVPGDVNFVAATLVLEVEQELFSHPRPLQTRTVSCGKFVERGDVTYGPRLSGFGRPHDHYFVVAPHWEELRRMCYSLAQHPSFE